MIVASAFLLGAFIGACCGAVGLLAVLRWLAAEHAAELRETGPG